jgi:hypothetical protein
VLRCITVAEHPVRAGNRVAHGQRQDIAAAPETFGMMAREAAGPDATVMLAMIHTTAITIVAQTRVANFISVSQVDRLSYGVVVNYNTSRFASPLFGQRLGWRGRPTRPQPRPETRRC